MSEYEFKRGARQSTKVVKTTCALFFPIQEGRNVIVGPSNSSSHRALKAWVRALELTAPIARNPSVTFPVLVDELAVKFGTAPALLSDGECLSYRALAQMSNRYARWGQRQGIAAGDVVCLLMPNCPAYVAIWLGITRIGGVVSLINTNLERHALAHSIKIVAPKHVIVGATLADQLAAALPLLAVGIKCWAHGEGNHGFARIDHDIDHYPGDRLESSECPPPSVTDRALYIYTSGTTGLPKAANVSHFRVMQWSHWFAGMMNIEASDRMYNCLPMYHSIGGVVAVAAPLVAGGSVTIRQKFSAAKFWDEVTEWNCTLFQYIGELCRYLVNAPSHPREAEHRIRLCCGNGLRPDIWEPFKERFRIPQILEYYAATESNFSLYNCEGKPGAIGRIPGFLAHRFPVALIKFDTDAGTPLRNDAGFCIRCSGNEVGEALGQIVDGGLHPGGRFEGYRDKAASDQKVMRNVFADGDAWYRTGDLMRRDEGGYFYFVDRVGDTFRWKGENVSTTEVAELIAAYPGIVEVIVYGVAIPGKEGRAGMAAVVASDHFDLGELHKHITERVPAYARPLFLRIRREFETTATFKPKKQDLVREGYDPAVVLEPLYVDDRTCRAFVRLDAALYDRIASGDVRL